MMVCQKCHERCERILKLWLGRKQDGLGAARAKERGQQPGYYDGLIDGVDEAIRALRQEKGLYWARLRREKELEEKK